MTEASDILRRHYKGARNLMTPRVLGQGMIASGIAYELSSGRGIEHEPIWGVTVVQKDSEGATRSCPEFSQLFFSEAKAREHIKELKRRFKQSGHGSND